ncbi:MAG: imidazole glycerol phosphate synthase subunit HisH [Clostridiaceae bacterium]
MIAIIDYGMGNLASVSKALDFLNIPCIITEKEDEIAKSSGIILPGVGAFPDACRIIKNKNIDKILYNEKEKKKPILGICLGMQLLFEKSFEMEEVDGLGLIKGEIIKITGDVKIPHMGWNNLKFNKPSSLLNGIEEDSYVYFVHSYYAKGLNDQDLNAYAMYSDKIPAVVSHENVYGTQFHPEKSGDVGLKILKNFGELIR